MSIPKVSSDLINSVLQSYYGSKDKPKKSEEDSIFDAYSFQESKSRQPTSSCDEPRKSKDEDQPTSSHYKASKYSDGYDPKAHQKYEDYKEDAYNLDQDAYGIDQDPYYDEMYPEEYDPYSSAAYTPAIPYPPLPQAYPPMMRPGMVRFPPLRPGLARFPPMMRPGMPPHPYMRPPHHEPMYPKRPYNFDDKSEEGPYKKSRTAAFIRDSIQDFDQLPPELTELFTDITCHLCLVTLRLPNLMELHYKGKNHMKRMKGWLYKFKGEHHLSNEKIEAMASHERSESTTNAEETSAALELGEGVNEEDMDMSFCKVCNLQISSEVVGRQHYAGKKHQRAVEKSQKSGGHPIPKPASNSAKSGVTTEKLSPWYCHVCKVASTNEEQYEYHLTGKRHKKAWKATQIVAPVGLQSIALSSHKPVKINDVDPEILAEYKLSLYCIHCLEYFSHQAEMTYHSCSNSELLCKACNTWFDTRPELKYHDCPRDHVCETCEETFENRDAHVCLKGVMDASYDCTLCRKSFNSVLSLDSHGQSKLHRTLLSKLAEVRPELSPSFNPIKTLPRVQFRCNQCEMNFKDDEELANHNKIGQHSISLGGTRVGNFPQSNDKNESPSLSHFPPTEKPHSAKDSASGNYSPLSEDGEKVKEYQYDIRNLDVNALLKGYKK